MESSIVQKKRKWREPGDPTKFRLHYPKLPIRKTEDWDNWMRSMMMDTRFTSSDRAILTAIAMHYNLTTGDCFPAQGRVAIEAGLGEGETATRMVRRAVNKAVELGWIKRTFRRGGSHAKNQTNLYELVAAIYLGRAD
jgi:hypothetical protein